MFLNIFVKMNLISLMLRICSVKSYHKGCTTCHCSQRVLMLRFYVKSFRMIALEELKAVFLCHFREKLAVWAIQNLLQLISRKFLQFPHYYMHVHFYEKILAFNVFTKKIVPTKVALLSKYVFTSVRLLWWFLFRERFYPETKKES